MADYVAVLNRAIASVGATTAEARQALYDKARKALVAQLESREPPLTALQLAEQKALLDRAVREVEAQHSGQAFRPAAPMQPPAPPSSEPPVGSPAQPAAQVQPPAARRDGPSEDAPVEDSAAEDGTIPEATARGRETFRAAVSESAQLGHAAASASRGARTMLDEVGRGPSEADEIAAIVEQVEAREEERMAARRDAAPLSPPPVGGAAGEPVTDSGTHDVPVRTGRGVMGWVWLVLIFLVLAGAVGLVWTQKDTIGGWFTQIAGVDSDRTPPVPEKNEDRLSDAQPVPEEAEPRQGEEGAEAPPSVAPAGPPETQAALIEENPDDASRAQVHQGTVRWTAREDGGETVVEAQIDIPEKRLVLAMTIRKNGDATLPASHVIELLFTLPTDFSGGGVSNVPGLLMKATPQAQGAALAGESIRVTNGYFWIGLSDADVELRRNMNELRQRDYIDIPVIYDNGRRAILSLAKGPDGDAAFEEAFRAWAD